MWQNFLLRQKIAPSHKGSVVTDCLVKTIDTTISHESAILMNNVFLWLLCIYYNLKHLDDTLKPSNCVNSNIPVVELQLSHRLLNCYSSGFPRNFPVINLLTYVNALICRFYLPGKPQVQNHLFKNLTVARTFQAVPLIYIVSKCVSREFQSSK